MRVISQELVQGVDPSNDIELSKLGVGEAFIIVNPELDTSVLDYLPAQLSIPVNGCCIKYKVGNGWIAKVFPEQWNGNIKILQVQPRTSKVNLNYYLESLPVTFIPDAWDLKYTHVWTYEGSDIQAIAIDYLPVTCGKKTIGSVKFIEQANMFDVVFISYNEPTAEDNWQRLLTKCPTAIRVNGVKGILNAHKAAAELATTEMFWVVDADAYLVDDFEFTSVMYDRNAVHIWHSLNPVNGLEYGYGGVKLFPRQALLDTTNQLVDVSTSLGHTRVIKQIACETRFNTDPFNTWKSAFRECAKLASGTIKNQISKDTQDRLNAWCNSNDPWAIKGAVAGRLYGEHTTELININNYEWLHEQFLSE